MAEISKRLIQKIEQNKLLLEQARLDKNTIKAQDDKISAQENHIGELELSLKEWERKQRDGYTAVGIVKGYVVDAVTVLPNSTFLYTQPIPKAIGTRKYNSTPFIKVENGSMVKDQQKYIRYKSI